MRWTDLALSSSLEIMAGQFMFLVAASAFRIRRLIDTRIGGIEAIEISSWPRLIVGVAMCNASFLTMHHLYLRYNQPVGSSLFVLYHMLTMVLTSITVVPILGLLIDRGKAIRVLTGRYKPEHSSRLIDITKNKGKSAQLIPRGAIFAYQILMIYTWITIGWIK